MLSLSDKITEIINEQVGNAQSTTCYRKPLIGFASAHDPLFNQMKKIGRASSLTPY
jgi:hypothetical protein